MAHICTGPVLLNVRLASNEQSQCTGLPPIKRSLSAPLLKGREVDQHAVNHHEPGNSVTETIFILMTVILGAGLLTMPKAASLAGGLGFTLITIGSCALLALTLCVIGQCLQKIDMRADVRDVNREDRGWNVLGRCAFGPTGERLMCLISFLDLSSANISFIVIAVANLKVLLPKVSHQGLACAVGIFTLVFVLSKAKTCDLSIFGLVILVPMVGCLAITAYELTMTGQMASDQQQLVPETFTQSFGLLLFAFMAHSEGPYFYQQMEDRSKWPVAVAWAFAGAAAVFLLVGLLGYYAFGDMVSDTYVANLGHDSTMAIITNPLPSSLNQWFPLVCSFLVFMKLLLTLPVLVNPTMILAKELVGVSGYLPSTCFVALFTLIACIAGDKMALVLELSGIVANNVICIILPCLVLLQLGEDLSRGRRALLVATIAIFSFYMVWGVWDTLMKQ